jgi:hypothetical protein
MKSHPEKPEHFDSELVAELLDQSEYPSNIGKVTALSDQWICFLKRDWHELIHYRLEYVEMRYCRAIEYHKETAYYRILAGVAFFVAALWLLFMLLSDPDRVYTQSAPMIIGVISLAVIGIRFITSTHRHVIRFEMPDETFTWRSPAIDFKSKAGAAYAVREYARNRGILRESQT